MSDNVPALIPKEKPSWRSNKYVPTVEKAEHRAMFSFYEQLGKDRNFKKVAKEFGKSASLIAILSATFHWVARISQNEAILKDPIIAATKFQVDDVRTKLVTVVHDIADTLYELAMLSKKTKLDQIEKLNETDQKKVASLNTAMGVFGVELKNPKALRDLLAILKEVVRFNDDKPSIPEPASHLTQIHNAAGAQLIIRDD